MGRSLSRVIGDMPHGENRRRRLPVINLWEQFIPVKNAAAVVLFAAIDDAINVFCAFDLAAAFGAFNRFGVANSVDGHGVSSAGGVANPSHHYRHNESLVNHKLASNLKRCYHGQRN